METNSQNSSNKRVVRTLCFMCIDECGIEVTVEDEKITKIRGLKDHPWNLGAMCIKGNQAINAVHHKDRLQYPLIKKNGEFQRATWDEALDLIAKELKEGREKWGPTSLDVLCGDPAAVEESTGWHLTWRFADIYGTPNRHIVDDICAATEFHGEVATLGKRCQIDPNMDKYSNCILVVGANPHKSSPWMGKRVDDAVKRGAKLLVIDPMRTSIAKKADVFAQLKPGTDGALLLAMIHTIIMEDLYDKPFVEKWTHGFDELKAHVKPFSPEWAEPITGVSKDLIREMSRMYATTKPAAMLWGLMPARQQCGFQNYRSMAILWALTGNIDVKGGNVRRSTGVHLHQHRLYELMDRPLVNADKRPIYDHIGPVKIGMGHCVNWGDMILKGKPFLVKNMIITAANPLVTWPNTKKLDKALDALNLLVVIDMFMTETAKKARVVLPACSNLERTHMSFVMRYTMLARKVIEPLYESRSICDIWTDLAKRMGYGEYFPWNSNEECLNYFLEPSGLSVEYLRDEHPTGIVPVKEHYGEYEKFGSFRTPSGKVEFYSEQLKEIGISPLPVYREHPDHTPDAKKEFPLLLISGIRELEFWHSQYHDLPKLRERCPYQKAEIHPDTAKSYGIEHEDKIIVETQVGEMEIVADVTENTRPDTIGMTHGWAGQNIIIDDMPKDPDSFYAPFTGILCRVRKAS